MYCTVYMKAIWCKCYLLFKKYYPQGDIHMVAVVAGCRLGLSHPVVALVAQMGIENAHLVGASEGRFGL